MLSVTQGNAQCREAGVKFHLSNIQCHFSVFLGKRRKKKTPSSQPRIKSGPYIYYPLKFTIKGCIIVTVFHITDTSITGTYLQQTLFICATAFNFIVNVFATPAEISRKRKAWINAKYTLRIRNCRILSSFCLRSVFVLVLFEDFEFTVYRIDQIINNKIPQVRK